MMKKTQTSQSAQGMAAIRALEAQKPSSARICDDPYARQFVGPWSFFVHRHLAEMIEWRAPGFIGFIVSRCRYIDDLLKKCLDDGFEQVVILGAGLDSRAYRSDIRNGPARVFEVDQPATQAAKTARVKRIFREIPREITYVPIDFNEETLDKLVESGYQRGIRCLFIWEGVVAYLKPEAVDATLMWVRSNSAPGSVIAFDILIASALEADDPRFEVRLSRFTRRFTGEGLVFGIERDRISEFMVQRGFVNVKAIGAGEFKRMYFIGDGEARPVADIYAIVEAMVP